MIFRQNCVLTVELVWLRMGLERLTILKILVGIVVPALISANAVIAKNQGDITGMRDMTDDDHDVDDRMVEVLGGGVCVSGAGPFSHIQTQDQSSGDCQDPPPALVSHSATRSQWS